MSTQTLRWLCEYGVGLRGSQELIQKMFIEIEKKSTRKYRVSAECLFGSCSAFLCVVSNTFETMCTSSINTLLGLECMLCQKSYGILCVFSEGT